MEAGSRAVQIKRRRAKAARAQLAWRWTLLGAVVLVVAGLALGLAYAGSPTRLAEGVNIAGVDVGGLTPDAAQRLLEHRSHELRNVPVVFTAGAERWAVPPTRLGIDVDWRAAVEGARRQGEGFGPVRGLRRLRVRVFGTDVAPPTHVWDGALRQQIALFARAVDSPHRDAALRRRGLRVAVVPGRDGHLLDRAAAADVIVRALASLSRAPVDLPIRLDPQTVTASDLERAAADARMAFSRPVRLALGPTRWRVPRWGVARIVQLPAGGRRSLAVAGPGAERFFSRLSRRIDRRPRNADFAITSTGVRVVPSRAGLALDVEAARRAFLAAALSETNRLARLSVATKAPARTTAEARAMGITGLVGGYETVYGGEPNRIHNVQLVAQLIDRTLIAPGATFSFNRTTGERTAEKGFREAPVIINGELQTGLGGGVCQVSTTVFNAAYEAGLKITARTNHALYIDHYPLARDATVNYPDLDLRFVNDTPRWLLLRTFVGPSSLRVNLYGSPVDRRVESETTPLVVTGETPVQRVSDPELYVGEAVTVEAGAPPRSTSVHRRVYNRSGKLLHDDVWSSYYRAEPTVVRVGTKPRPEPKPEPKTRPESQPAAPGAAQPNGGQAPGSTVTTTPSRPVSPPSAPPAGATTPPASRP